jgi:transcriptional regulator of met regulon
VSDPATALAFVIVGVLLVAAFVSTFEGMPPPTRCGNCGRKMGVEHLPQHVRDLMAEAGVKTDPGWYVGAIVCPYPAARIAPKETR